MPANYTTKTNDTPQAIAIKFYGDGSQYVLILQANPTLQGDVVSIVSDTRLAAGQDIIIPDLVDPTPAESDTEVKTTSLFDMTAEKIGADDPDEVSVIIKGKAFKFFDGFTLDLSYDTLANEFAFTAPFDPGIPEIREAFKQIYQPTNIYIGGKLVVKGQSAALPVLNPGSNSVNVSGYGITGNLARSTIIEPFEYEAGNSYSDIITDISRRFGLAVVIDLIARAIANKPYENPIVFSNTAKVGGKLTQLSKERGITISDTFSGKVLVTKPKLQGKTVQAFVSGDETTTIRILPEYNPDALSTSYIGYVPQVSYKDGPPESKSISGINMPGILPRLHAIVTPEGSDINIEDAIRGERGRSYAEWYKVSIEARGWRDRDGNLYQPDTLVTARSPRVMMYDDIKLFVRKVRLTKVNNIKKATLDVILPEALSGLDLQIEL